MVQAPWPPCVHDDVLGARGAVSAHADRKLELQRKQFASELPARAARRRAPAA